MPGVGVACRVHTPAFSLRSPASPFVPKGDGASRESSPALLTMCVWDISIRWKTRPTLPGGVR